jgi:hypothetical protein
MVPSYSYTSAIQYPNQSGDGIVGHQFNKRVESFTPSYTQSLLPADLNEKILYFGFNTPYKKSAKQEYSRQFMKSICRTGK